MRKINTLGDNARSKWIACFDARALPYILVIPTLGALFLLIICPLLYGFGLSFFEWSPVRPQLGKTFIFISNYINVLRDQYFWISMRTSLIFTIGSVGLEFFTGLGMALILSRRTRGRNIINSIVIMPLMVTPVVVGLIWRYMYDSQFGLIYYLLSLVGLADKFGGLTQSSTALLSTIIVDVWQMTPFVILVLLAGINSFPDEPYEAARIDGASEWQLFRYITLPMLKPLIALVLVMRTMDTLKVFDIIFILTKGGPGMATETIGLFTYKMGFNYFRMGPAMALSFLTLIMLVVITGSLLKLWGQDKGIEVS
ncbi:MAG: sugar ABC transporter permease [Firmicutes bacterium]|nr:sugar ABC transporter permease [Bacillota bacterium]